MESSYGPEPLCGAAGILALALVLMVTACPNPAGGNDADKAGLNSTIADAETAKAGVSESADGTDVSVGTKWAAPSDFNTFNSAINTAKKIRDTASASQIQVDGAVTTLRTAIDVFNAARQDGKKALTNISVLNAKIAAAELAIANVTVAADRSGAALGAA
jgi:hypothetical protein